MTKMETTIKKKMDFSLSLKTKEMIFDIITYLFVVLFIYTAISKILTINLYTVILGLLPLIGKYNSILAYVIPGIEIIVSVLLIVPITKRKGLIASLILMIMFTSYITFMVFTTPHLPCTCGGVFKELSWTEHIIFNLSFIGMAVFGLFIHKNT